MVEKTRVEGLSIEEFSHRYETEGPFELIDGEIVKLSPTIHRHTKIIYRLMNLILDYINPRQLGVIYPESPFILPELSGKRRWVKGSRVPDLMFIRAERLAVYEQEVSDEEPLALVPDLVVEIVSPTDSFTAVGEKMARYLLDGVEIVWVIDPRRRVVWVSTSEGRKEVTADQTLSADPVIPGLTIQVSRIFETQTSRDTPR